MKLKDMMEQIKMDNADVIIVKTHGCRDEEEYTIDQLMTIAQYYNPVVDSHKRLTDEHSEGVFTVLTLGRE